MTCRHRYHDRYTEPMTDLYLPVMGNHSNLMDLAGLILETR